MLVYAFSIINNTTLIYMKPSNVLCILCRTMDSFRIHLTRWQKSSFNIVKVHNMKHYTPSIRQSRALVKYNSNMYEHLHMAMMKTGYRMSNKRNFLDHIVKCNRRLKVLRSNALDSDGYACLSVKNLALEKVC